MVERDTALHRLVSECHPKISRGRVWCVECGGSSQVNPMDAIQYGWPVCCGLTMTIDSPSERISPHARLT